MEKTKRQSNFELLRIFAMFMIILAHVQQQGPQWQLSGDTGFFNQPIIYLRLLILEIGTPLGAIGNGLFILISGYFMNSNLNIDTGKIAKKLLLQLGFAMVVLLIADAAWVTFFKNVTLSLGKVTIADFNNSFWFIGYYFLTIILAKLFLNKFTAKLTRNQFGALLLTILAVSQFSWTGTMLESLATGLRVQSIGIFFFLLGGYIARYNPFENLKAYAVFLIIAGVYGIRFLSQYNIVSQSIDEFVKSNSVGIFNFQQSVQAPYNDEISTVIFAICWFELFRRLKVPNNAVINFAAKATLMIYIIHDNVFYRHAFRNDTWLETLSTNVALYCLKWVKWAAMTFAIGLAVFTVYTLLGKLLPRLRSLFVVQESRD
jgi:hypothetical protein